MGVPSRELSEVDLWRGGHEMGRWPGSQATPRGEEFREKLENRPVRATPGTGVRDSLEGRDP